MNAIIDQRRFPAEWELQEAVWFSWPTRTDTWPGLGDQIRGDFAALFALVSRFQTVRILCPKNEHDRLFAKLCSIQANVACIELFDYTTDDVWCRDFGPIFLKTVPDQKTVASSWEYNAWGGKFELHARDNATPEWIAETLKLDCVAFPIILEGGAVESSGAGTLLTTEAVLLNPNRNHSGKSREAITRILQAGFGVSDVLWLKEGLEGDDTDGHIDNIARFFAADGIFYASAPAEDQPNHARLTENLELLRAARQPDGSAFRLVELPLPAPVYAGQQRLAASYLNFLIVNGAVIVPTYNQPEADARALEIIDSQFPGREVIGFDCRDILREGGAIHCLSQPQPI